MIRINLLPKEERSRRRQLPAIKVPHVGAVVPFAVIGIVVAAVGTQTTLQGRSIRKLQQDIQTVEQESQRYKPQLEKIRQITQRRQEVRNRLDIIARLDRERYYRVQLMDDLSQAVTENMWLGSFQEINERRFQIEGVTFSNFNVARLMTVLEEKDRFQNVDLSVAQRGTINDLDVVQFTLVSGATP